MSTHRSRRRPGGSPVAVAASDGVAIPGPAGQHMTVKISGAASYGAYSLIEHSQAPGAPGPPAHLHRDHEEAFYVVEGELTLAGRGRGAAGRSGPNKPAMRSPRSVERSSVAPCTQARVR